MRGGPSESACRGRFQTTFRWLWSKAMVVSIEGKGSARTGSGDRQEEDRKGTTVEVSKGSRDDVKNRGVVVTAGNKAPTKPVYGRSGIRHERWPELADEAVERNVGTWTSMLTEKPQVTEPRGRKYGSEARDGTARSSREVLDKGMEPRRCVKEPDSMSQPVMGGAR
jgi:hypothetical protein